MPIYNALLQDIDTKETRRYAGLRQSEFPQELIEEACMEARLLAQPKGIWLLYDYDDVAHTVLSDEPFTLQGESIVKHLKGCSKVIFLAVTVGDTVEEAVTKHFSEGKYAFSTLLDAAATTAVEQIADSMEKYLQMQMARQGLEMKWRFSPGYGDWDIHQQTEVLALSKGADIGMSLTESMMLTPRKSITAVIGLYYKEQECRGKDKKHDCSCCSKSECQFRQ